MKATTVRATRYLVHVAALHALSCGGEAEPETSSVAGSGGRSSPADTEFDQDAPSGDSSADGAPAAHGESDDAPGSGIWSARPTWSMFDFDRRGRAVVVGTDGSLYITGGEDRGGQGRTLFHNFWLARFSSAGELEWEQIESADEGNWGGLSLALTPDGVITTTTVRSGNDSAELKRYDSSGTPLGDFSLETGIKWLATSPSGELIGAGLDVVEERAGRAFTELWVGGLSGESISWQKTLRGTDGSFSFAWDLALTEDTVFVAGMQGSSAESDASHAWVGAGPLGNADFDWEQLPGRGSGQSDTIALAPDGSLVVAGRGDRSFVHHYEAGGTRVWEHDLRSRPAAVVAVDAGYAVGYDFDDTDAKTASEQIDFTDWDGTLLWRFEDSSCETVRDLAVDGGDLIALLDCDSSLGLFRIPFDQTAAGLGGVDVGVAALRACTTSNDCESGHSCQNGTCAQDCTATRQCASRHHCVFEQDDQMECPELAPVEPGTPGVCLPRCSTDEDCGSVAPGLRCLNESCVLEIPRCG